MSEGGTEQCETEGCHRQTSMVMEYEVWKGSENHYPTRQVCQPCANAMRFRETFAQGTDSWSVHTATDRSEGER